MTNADVIEQFLDRKDHFTVGETFTLPDVDQVYEVVTVRPFTKEGKFFLFVDLAAICAVEGCDELVMLSMDVFRWRKSRYVGRCCPEHRYQFHTPMKGAWKTSEELQEPVVRRRRRKVKRVGSLQRLVLDTFEGLMLVDGRPKRSSVIEMVVASMDPPTVGRDTRKQRTERAYDLLVKSGFLSPGAG